MLILIVLSKNLGNQKKKSRMLADILIKIAADELKESGSKYYPRPSLAGPERCMRQMVYWARGEQRKELPGRTAFVFDDGHWHCELSQDWLRKSAYRVHSEEMGITIPDAYPWLKGGWTCSVCDKKIDSSACHGHVDFIVTDLLTNDFVVEHKSINHFGFERYLKGELPYDYLTQLAIYIKGAQLENDDIDQGLLLVKNKNTGAYLEFRCEYASDSLTVVDLTHHSGEVTKINEVLPNIVQNAFAKFSAVQNHVDGETLPPRPYDFDHWRCSYCGYRETCWVSYVEEHQTLKSDVVFENEFADMVRYERECQAHESEMKKERKDMQQKIKDTLKSLNVRSGRAGEYLIDWKVMEVNKIDQTLIPGAVLEKCKVKTPQERLVIKKVKE